MTTKNRPILDVLADVEVRSAVAASKISRVIGRLRAPEGATLEELAAVTGWLPHTVRAALTGLRKKGHVISRDKRSDASCYRIADVG